MRADNLLCLRRRKFILTTDSKHGLRIYPNLAKDMVLTRINQLWVADITYIRLQVEFVYLAVLLDAFSRRCIGWALQRSSSRRDCAFACEGRSKMQETAYGKSLTCQGSSDALQERPWADSRGGCR